MDKYTPKDKELGRFRAEAAELLRIEANKRRTIEALHASRFQQSGR